MLKKITRDLNFKIIFIYVLSIIVFGFIQVAISGIIDLENLDVLTYITFQSVSNIIFYTTLALLLVYISNVYLLKNQWVYVKNNSYFVIWLSVLGFYLMWAVVFLMSSVFALFKISELPDNEQVFREIAASSWYNLLFTFILAGILAPIVEELVFRKAIYGLVDKKWGPLIAIVISSLLFALVHEFQSPIFILQYFSMGVILAFIYYYSGKMIFVPILAHSLYNLSLLILMNAL